MVCISCTFIIEKINVKMRFVFICCIISLIDSCPEVPKTCARGMISFFLYTRPHVKPYELVLDDLETIKNAPFLPQTDFKVIIHGYTSNKTNSPALFHLRNEYFKQKQWNLIVLDWGILAQQECYFSSAYHSVPLVGKCTADLLKIIFDNFKDSIKPENFHAIGFSMGAQVCASLSLSLRPIVLPRITGLDPAFPLFTPGITDGDRVLNREHAIFVDCYHSNAGILGVHFSKGHYDIYLNDGTFQPGCHKDDVSCSHRRSVEIFSISINLQTKFIAEKCDHHWVWVTFRKCDGKHKIKIEVGEHIKPPPSEKETGTYQLKTTDKAPYAIDAPPF